MTERGPWEDFAPQASADPAAATAAPEDDGPWNDFAPAGSEAPYDHAADDPGLEIDITGGRVGTADELAADARLVASAPNTRTPAEQQAYIDYLGREAERYRAEADKSPLWEATKDTAREVGRQFSVGARAAAEGIGNTLDFFGEPLARGLEAVGLPEQQRFAALANRGADAVGLARPQAKDQMSYAATRGIAGAIGGVGVGQQLARTGLPVVAAVGEGLAAQPGVQMVSGGTGAASAEAARQNGAGARGQMIAGLVGGIAPVAAAPAAAAGVRGALRGGEAGRERVAEQINNFATVGATPSVGQATNAWRNMSAESLLSGAPTSAGVMAARAERQAEQIGAGLRSKAEALSKNPSAENAGRAIERGADLFARNVRAMRNALYWQADRQIPQSTVLPLARTRQALDSMTTPTPGAENTTRLLINPKLSSAPSHHSAGGIREALEADIAAAQQQGMAGIPYSAARDLRSRIGRELEDFTLSADKPTAEYRRLYAALSADLEDAAKRAGPDAERAMRRANNYFKASADRLATIERVIDRNGGPERVYNAVMAGTQDGATVLRSVMRSLPKDGQRAVTAAVIKRMGLATPGAQDAAGEAFSAATFLTNWNKVSPEARRALFDVHGPAFARDMDRIAAVAETIKSGSKVYANPSGTANRVGAYTYGSAISGAALTGQPGTVAGLLLGGLGANVAARILTRPATVHFLAETTRMPIGALPQAARQLYNIAKSEQDDELMSVAERLQAAAEEGNRHP